jgi:hypothetical protein
VLPPNEIAQTQGDIAIDTLLQQAVAALFFLLIMLLGCSMILAPTIILWLSLQRLWPTLFPVKVWQMTLLSVLLSSISYGWLAPETDLLAQSLLALQLTFGWSLALLPLQPGWQLWRRRRYCSSRG